MKITEKKALAIIAAFDLEKKLLTARKGNVRDSLRDLLTYGTTITGSSGYSGGWAKKSIWTGQTAIAAQDLGLSVITGNNAPRGGAGGEFVALSENREENKEVHDFIYARVFLGKLEDSRRLKANKKWKIENDKKIKTIKFEAKSLLPFVPNIKFFDHPYTGEKKSKFLSLQMKRLLNYAGNPKLTDFWQVYKELAIFLNDIKLKEYYKNLPKIAKETNDKIIDRKLFHDKTGACYTGIDRFISDNLQGRNKITLSELVKILPTYAKYFI